ncbi:uncharacterized protein [Spinacia oleracea]|uniref:Uncharacterized protein n=1 Tax=Spinacia oleracea TaxID=3562 RepID=A0A9R0J9I9_SPIOL|nr:uncharacterized protein LOC110801429 [Spinacia oleracea]
MHHLCSLSPQTPLPTNYFLFNPITKTDNPTTNNNNNYYCYYYGLIRRINPVIKPKRGNNYQRWISRVGNDDSEFEVDTNKARQALSDLDQQLESLSVKQVNPPKIRASSIGNLKEQVKNEPPEITESFLGYTAFVFFMFSIFYNILFITVIKPSIDGPDKDILSTNDVTIAYRVPD